MSWKKRLLGAAGALVVLALMAGIGFWERPLSYFVMLRSSPHLKELVVG
jgi:hypothetical protein